MAQAIPTPITPTTRRKARGMIARTTAAPEDPIFAAIERHRRAAADYVASTARKFDLEEGSTEWRKADAENSRALDEEAAAFTALFVTPPTSFAGIAEVLAYADAKEWPTDRSGDGSETTTVLTGGYERDGRPLEAARKFLTMIARTQRGLLAA
jgi:hypothetical protein